VGVKNLSVTKYIYSDSHFPYTYIICQDIYKEYKTFVLKVDTLSQLLLDIFELSNVPQHILGVLNHHDMLLYQKIQDFFYVLNNLVFRYREGIVIRTIHMKTNRRETVFTIHPHETCDYYNFQHQRLVTMMNDRCSIYQILS
jgi:hypothetical protein